LMTLISPFARMAEKVLQPAGVTRENLSSEGDSRPRIAAGLTR
jgi:hypothetical protein